MDQEAVPDPRLLDTINLPITSGLATFLVVEAGKATVDEAVATKAQVSAGHVHIPTRIIFEYCVLLRTKKKLLNRELCVCTVLYCLCVC